LGMTGLAVVAILNKPGHRAAAENNDDCSRSLVRPSVINPEKIFFCNLRRKAYVTNAHGPDNEHQAATRQDIDDGPGVSG